MTAGPRSSGAPPGRRPSPPFGPLDHVYVPTVDGDATATFYVEALGAVLAWKVRGMGTTVACLRVSGTGPDVLLAGHLRSPGPILIYRVDRYAATVDALQAAGVELTELEIPAGPCASFTAAGGQRYAVYELIRPEAASSFEGRIDP